MSSEPIHIDDTSDIAHALDGLPERPVLLERNGTLYRVSVLADASSGADYDAEAYREALHRIAGIITPDEAADMIERLYEYRRQDAKQASRS